MSTGSEPQFEREYFESKSSYGQAGGYSTLADRSQEYYAEYFRIARKSIPTITNGGSRSAIEVGCAFGAGSEWLAQHGWRVLATDVSAYACEQARKRLPSEVQVREVDIRKDTLGQFDLVVCIQVIEHVNGEDFTRALCELVAPNGHLLIATPNPLSLSPYRKFQADPTHVNERPLTGWISSVRANGLELRQAATYHVVPIVSRFAIRYIRVPQFIGYDEVLVFRRPA